MIYLKVLKKAYSAFNISRPKDIRNWRMISNKEYSNNLISEYLQSSSPCMISRFGSTELSCLVNYLGVKDGNKNIIEYIRGNLLPWWWEKWIIHQMSEWSGFFPSNPQNLERFSELMIQHIPNVDLLGSWLIQEKYFSNELRKVKKVMLEDLEPFFSPNPWTHELKGKKVLVIHPFSELIENQYSKRELIFPDGLLPDFTLKTLKAVQSLSGNECGFDDWFEALEWMKSEVERIDFDIAIIGAGAYGFLLASHIKSIGKKSIHLAGITQLLFGIVGSRWENYIVWPYTNLFNQYWVRPGDEYKISNANSIEGACYW